MDLYTNTVLLIFLILGSAFFAAAEVSFLSMTLVRVHSLVEKGVSGSETISNLRRERRKVIISLLIGSSIINIAASAIATDMALDLFGQTGLGIAVGVMSFLLLTFGEIAPKSFATANGEHFMLFFGPLLMVYYKITYPLVMVFDFINRIIPGVYSRATIIEQFTEEEVRTAVKLGAIHKGITEMERKMIENVLEFNDRTVGEVMTSKKNVITLSSKMNIFAAYKKALASHYSRFPVVDESGEPIGTVSVKILGRALLENPNSNLLDVVWKPVLVNKNEKASNAFGNLQTLGRNIAVVVDDQEKFAGVVTLEDLLEELVGEIK